MHGKPRGMWEGCKEAGGQVITVGPALAKGRRGVQDKAGSQSSRFQFIHRLCFKLYLLGVLDI